jgi:MerR family mercuric resistance operon transcriptional regulator
VSPQLSRRAARQHDTAARGAALTRGALAARTGCNLETVRFYERIALLPAPPRSLGGHRLYGPDFVKRLTFIRRSRDLGFTIAEIREVLHLVDGAAYTCAQVEQTARVHARQIRHKIAALRRLEKVFETMAAECSGGDLPACPIIDALFEPAHASDSRHPTPEAAAG